MNPVIRPNARSFAHLLPWEDEGAYAKRVDDLAAAYAPQGPVEISLVERLALILQRRDRLALAERAVHLAALGEAVEEGYHLKRLTRRVGVATGGAEEPDDVIEVLAKSDADDAAEREELARNRACTRAALAILEEGGEDAYERALDALDEDGRVWWTEWLEDEQASVEPNLHPTAESLKGFLEREAVPFEEKTEAAIAARPALRLQAHGESIDPHMLERLLAIDTRLDRQLEKTLGMLIKLQEMRGKEEDSG